MRRWSWLLVVAGLAMPGLAGADEPPAPVAGPADSSLRALIETYETLGAQIAEAQRQAPKARGRERRRWEADLARLTADQDRVFETIERIVGPLPPAIRHEPAIPLEEALRARQQRDEAILERDVDRRLPRN